MKDQQIEKAMDGIENRIRHIYNCGYQQGYEDGKKQQDKLWAGEHYRQELTAKGYYRGLEDAWETAKQIVSKSSAKMSDIFGEVYAESVFEKFTADQAMKKIMDYEEQQKPHSLLDAYFQMRAEQEPKVTTTSTDEPMVIQYSQVDGITPTVVKAEQEPTSPCDVVEPTKIKAMQELINESYYKGFIDGKEEGLREAKQEPCDDAISRQAVLKQLKSCLTGGETEYQYVKLHIDSLPPVRPQEQWERRAE